MMGTMMNLREENRERMTRRDLALIVAMTAFSWLAVVGAIRVAYIVAGWLS